MLDWKSEELGGRQREWLRLSSVEPDFRRPFSFPQTLFAVLMAVCVSIDDAGANGHRRYRYYAAVLLLSVCLSKGVLARCISGWVDAARGQTPHLKTRAKKLRSSMREETNNFIMIKMWS